MTEVLFFVFTHSFFAVLLTVNMVIVSILANLTHLEVISG